MLARALFVLVLGATAAQAQDYRPPRTAYGQPDLQGVWDGQSLTSLQRPKDFKALVATPEEVAAYERRHNDRYAKGVAPLAADAPAPSEGKVEDESPQWRDPPNPLARVRGEIRSSVIVDPADGRLPYTAAARAAAEQALKDEEVYDDPEGRPFDERCLLGGGGGVAPPMASVEILQIVQTEDHVLLLSESNHEARIVRLGDRRHAPAGVTPWMGDAVGWWEGDTLVVETTNLSPNDRWRWNDGDWVALSPAARIEERFTRTAAGEILYSFRVDDPGPYTRPWRGEMPLRATKAQVFEYACHEGNYSLSNILAGARAQERAAAARGAP